METFEILFAVPVPVGHRVELRWYEAPTGGFFGNKAEVRPHEPQVIDLDTGVTHAPGWMYASTPSPAAHRRKPTRTWATSISREKRWTRRRSGFGSTWMPVRMHRIGR